MPRFSSVRRVRHDAAKMFELVADVERYPEFVPLCKALRVIKRSTNEAGVEVLIADMVVGYKAIVETFVSRVTLDRARLMIHVEYVDGPFRYLDNKWTFKPCEGGTEVGFYIAYEFRNFALGLLMGAAFDKAFRRFSEAFEARADAVYGDG